MRKSLIITVVIALLCLCGCEAVVTVPESPEPTKASEMLLTTTAPEESTDILGHVDVSTTMNIYVDAMKELKKKEMSAFSSRTGPSGSAGMTLEELSQVKTTEQWTTA